MPIRAMLSTVAALILLGGGPAGAIAQDVKNSKDHPLFPNRMPGYTISVYQHVDQEEHTMIIGAHSIIYTKDAAADRAFFRDVLRFPHVDAHDGWLIFGLPPSEVAMHPGEENDQHEFYLMVDDVERFIAEMGTHGVPCGPIHNQGWGMLTQITLPGGGTLGVYQPRHARPEATRV